MLYQEFKDHLIAFLWKAGDAHLIASLDNLIIMADTELRKVLKADLREIYSKLTIVAEDTTLPAGTHSIRSVTMDQRGYGEFKYVEPARLFEERARTNSNTWVDQYSLVGRDLLLCGPATAQDPQDFYVDLYINIPDFKTANSSWVADEHLDLYTYCVLKHTAPFLREDERIPVWVSLFNSALETANSDFAHNEQRGVYASKKLPHQASVRRGRL